MATPIEVDDAIVLLLGAPVARGSAGEIQGITRLEKLVFLLEKETNSKNWLDEDAKFEPYNFGPFSSRVYQAVDTLAAAGLIVDSSRPSADEADSWEEQAAVDLDVAPPGRADNPYVTRDFRLTDLGWKYFHVIERELPRGALKEIEEFKRRFAFLPLRQLIRYVYFRYKEYTTKSLIRGEVFGSDSAP